MTTFRHTFRHHHPTNTAELELAAHHGHDCEVLRELGDEDRDPEVGPMFRVRFADGFEADLHADELDPEFLPEEFVTDIDDASRIGWVLDTFANGSIVRVRWDGEFHADGEPFVTDIGAVRLRHRDVKS